MKPCPPSSSSGASPGSSQMNGATGGKTLLTCSTSGESRSLSSLLSAQISGATSRQQHPTLRGMDLLQQPGTFCNTWGIASRGLQSVNDGYQFCQQQQGGRRSARDLGCTYMARRKSAISSRQTINQAQHLFRRSPLACVAARTAFIHVS